MQKSLIFSTLFRNGTLHLMSGVCALVTKAELEYWGIDELLLEPCCALKYYPEIELCCKGKLLIINNSEKCFAL